MTIIKRKMEIFSRILLPIMLIGFILFQLIIINAFAYDSTLGFKIGDAIAVSLVINDNSEAANKAKNHFENWEFTFAAIYYDDLVLELVDYQWSAPEYALGGLYGSYSKFSTRGREQIAYHGYVERSAVVFDYCGDSEIARPGAKIVDLVFLAKVDGTVASAGFLLNTIPDSCCTFDYITITPSSGGSPASPYTIAATSATAAVTQGEGFDVNIVWSKTEGGDPVSAMGLLNYDAALVTPDFTGLFGVSQNGAGQLKFSGFGLTGSNIVTIPFTANNPGEATFSVSGDSGFALAVGLDGDVFMQPDANAGDDLTIAINAIAQADPITFSTNFNGLPGGYTLLKYKVDAKPINTVWKYDGNAMHYANIGDEHFMLWIVADTVDSIAANALITPTSGTPTANNGDINGDGKLQIVDAQIAYDIANGHANYTGDGNFTHLSIMARLMADVNGDGQVTIVDAQAIQYKLHNGSFPVA